MQKANPAYPHQPVAPVGRFAVEAELPAPATSTKGARHVTFSQPRFNDDDANGDHHPATTSSTAAGSPTRPPPPVGQRRPTTAPLPRPLHRVPASDSALVSLPPRTGAPVSRQQRSQESSRDSEEQFVDGNYFFNHLVRERAAEDYNVASVLREKDRDRRKHGQFGSRAAFATFGAGRGIDRLSTSLPSEGYYYYHHQPQPQPHHHHHHNHHHHYPTRHLGSDADVGLPEVPFAGGLEIEIPPRRHAGLGGGGLRPPPDTAGGGAAGDRLLMVTDTHRREPSTRFGRDYFRSTEPPPPGQQPDYRGGQQHRRSSPPLHRPTVIRPGNYFPQNGSRSLTSSGPDHERSHEYNQQPATTIHRPAVVRPGNSSTQTGSWNYSLEVDSDRKNEKQQQQQQQQPAATFHRSQPLDQFNSYNVRTGRFQPDPEQLLPPPKPPPKLGSALNGVTTTAARVGGHLNHGADGMEEEEEEWPLPVRRRPIVPRPHPDLTRFASAANVRSPTVGSDAVPEHRLSTSYDPARTTLRPSWRDTTLPRVVDAGESIRQAGGETSTSRKVVTWEDQTNVANNNTSLRPTTSGVHDNRAFVSDQTENDTGNNDTTVSTNDNTNSFSRDVVSYPINLSLSRSLLINDLENVDQFALFEVSTSKLCWAESFTGSSWLDRTKQYKFVVLNRQEEVLFIGTEEDGAISNCIISPHKSSFRVRLLDANGHDVIHFRRLYPVKTKANFSYGQKNKYRLEVVTPSGHVIGNVEKTYDSDTYYVLEDRAGECLFLVQRSCICTCPLFWDYEFKILMPDNEEEVGDISWSYLTCQKEQFNGTEISFPIDLNATSKIMLLGVCFLLNFSRWQSSYLDSLYNPRSRKDREPRSNAEANREADALLATSPDNRSGVAGGGEGAR